MRIESLVVAALVVIAGFGVFSTPASAQQYELYDRLSIALEASLVALDTTIRVDSKEHGIGTEINFESDFDLEQNKTIATLSLEWRPWKRHRLGMFFKDIDRDSTTQAATEIVFDDIVIPIGADVKMDYEIQELGIAYTYILRPRERSSFGFGGGFRVLEVAIGIFGRLEGEDELLEWRDDADVTGPLPFIGVEYRHMFSEKWRFQTDLGLFYLEFGDITGAQALGRFSFEHLSFRNLGFGIGFGASVVDVDVDDNDWRGVLGLDIYDVRVFMRIRL